MSVFDRQQLSVNAGAQNIADSIVWISIAILTLQLYFCCKSVGNIIIWNPLWSEISQGYCTGLHMSLQLGQTLCVPTVLFCRPTTYIVLLFRTMPYVSLHKAPYKAEPQDFVIIQDPFNGALQDIKSLSNKNEQAHNRPGHFGGPGGILAACLKRVWLGMEP